MKKSFALLVCLGLCLTVAFFFTQSAQSEAEFLAHGDDGIVDATNCLASGCHVAAFGAEGSLHSVSAHSSCAACHEGGVTTAGTVFADSCVVCHPAGNPGTCPLVEAHGASCLECHTECAPETTTTTTMAAAGHGDNGIVDASNCLASGCHVAAFGAEGSLHSVSAHSNCAACHDGAPAAGNVFADSCVVCHPAGNPGTCPLVDAHGASCLECHTECAQVTTTTTTSVPVTGDIEVSPESIFRSRWVVIPALLTIRGTGAEFDRRTSKPSYSPDNALIPLPSLQLGANLIVQTVLVKPEWWALAGNQTVTVTVDGSSADFDIELLPFILDK